MVGILHNFHTVSNVSMKGKPLQNKDFLWLLDAPLDEWEKATIVMALFGEKDVGK